MNLTSGLQFGDKPLPTVYYHPKLEVSDDATRKGH